MPCRYLLPSELGPTVRFTASAFRLVSTTLVGLAVIVGMLSTPVRAQAPKAPGAQAAQAKPQDPELERILEEGLAAAMRADLAAALPLFQRGLDLAHRAGDTSKEALFLYRIAHLLSDQTPPDNAKILDYYTRALALYEKLNEPLGKANPVDLNGQAKTLNNIGTVFSSQGQTAKAIEFYLRSLALFERLKDDGNVASRHHNLGIAYQRLDQPDKAIMHRRSALVLFDKLGLEHDAALELGDLAYDLYRIGKIDQARDYWLRAVELNDKLGNTKQLAEVVLNLGAIHEYLPEPKKAMDYLLRAVTLYEQLGDKNGIAAACMNLGRVCLDLGRQDNALPHLLRAEALFEELGNTDQLVNTLVTHSAVCHRLGQIEQGIAAIKRGLALAEKGGNERRIAMCLHNQGAFYRDTGEQDKSLACLTRALAIRKGLNDPLDIATSLIALGHAYAALGQMERAQDFAQRSLAIREKQGDATLILDSLITLSEVFADSGRFDGALAFSERAMALARKLGRDRDCGRALNVLGGVYGSLGQIERKVDYHSQALDLYERLAIPKDISRSLHFLGLAYTNAGQWEKALSCHERSMAAFEKLGHKEGVAGAAQSLGELYMEMGQYDKAVKSLERSLALSEQIRSEFGAIGCLSDLGGAHILMGQNEKALPYLVRARVLADKSGNPELITPVYRNLAEAYGNLNRLDEAQECSRQAIRSIEMMGEMIGDPAQVSVFLKSLKNVYSRHAILISRKRPADGLVLAERGRAQGLARQIGQTRANFARFLSPEDTARLAAMTEKRTAADRLLHSATTALEQALPEARPYHEKQLAESTLRARDAGREFDLLRDSLYARYPQYRRVRAGEPPSMTQFTELARRNPDTLYLEWAMVDDTILVFALSHGSGLQTVTIQVDQKELTERIRKWRTAITGLRASEPRLAQSLYHTLMGPLAKAGILKAGRYARVVVAAEGPLLDLPFAALMDGSSKRLTERFAVSSCVSLSMLTWPATPQKSSGALLCVVDPSGKRSERFASVLRGGLGPLRYARDEAKRVTQLFPGAVGLAGPLAREAEVKKVMGRYAILHFATHGILMDQDGLRSWLLLAAEPLESSEDGRLEAREVLGIPLSARLAVLSACSTGLGQKSMGEGLLGLAWAFQGAGCPSVVASLWPVDDAATGKLMSRFYREVKAGRRLDDALRTAQQAVRKEYPLPVYWAGFHLIGRSEAIGEVTTGTKGTQGTAGTRGIARKRS